MAEEHLDPCGGAEVLCGDPGGCQHLGQVVAPSSWVRSSEHSVCPAGGGQAKGATDEHSPARHHHDDYPEVNESAAAMASRSSVLAIFPLAVMGMVSNRCTDRGTMCLGRRLLRNASTSSGCTLAPGRATAKSVIASPACGSGTPTAAAETRSW